MDLSPGLELKRLLTCLMMTEPSTKEREAVISSIRERFPIESHVYEYAAVIYMIGDERLVSFVLRVLYIQGRKRPDDPFPKKALQDFMSSRSDSHELRTQAFMHLLLLDIDAAEYAARCHMPQMLPLVSSERAYPTIRRDDADAAYEEALLKMLFH